jgi:hypothetical protein
MECENKNCTRTATTKNQQYHPDKWLCTYHANKEKVGGRRKRVILLFIQVVVNSAFNSKM